MKNTAKNQRMASTIHLLMLKIMPAIISTMEHMTESISQSITNPLTELIGTIILIIEYIIDRLETIRFYYSEDGIILSDYNGAVELLCVKTLYNILNSIIMEYIA